MGDVANILGIKSGANRSGSTTPVPSLSLNAGSTNKRSSSSGRVKGGSRLTGIQKEVMNLLGAKSASDLPPIMPSKAVGSAVPSRNLGTSGSIIAQEGIKKGIASMKNRPAKKWVWAPFQSSARSDKVEFSHWVKADVEYPDYPYARFDVHLDPVVYNDDEYERYLKDEPAWTKNDTDKLMEMARIYELRWPIIYDRFNTHSNEHEATQMAVRNTEELQYRYYFIATRLTKVRMELAAASQAQANGANTTTANNLIGSAALDAVNKIIPSATLGTGSSTVEFNIGQERARRMQLDIQWKRSKAEEREESELRAELKRIETQIRKMKKSGKHLLESSNVDSTTSLGTGPSELDKYFVPNSLSIEGPYLQSDRLLTPTNTDSIINKTLLKKMELVVKELNIPDRLVPTKNTCDMYDNLRKSVLTLLTLQKLALKKETEVASKRNRLAREYPGSINAVKGAIGILDKAAAAAAQANKPPPSSSTTSTKKNSAPSQSKNKSSKTVAKNSKSLEAMANANKKSNKRKSVKRSNSSAENKNSQTTTAPSSASSQPPTAAPAPASDDSTKPNKKRVRKS